MGLALTLTLTLARCALGSHRVCMASEDAAAIATGAAIGP